MSNVMLKFRHRRLRNASMSYRSQQIETFFLWGGDTQNHGLQRQSRESFYSERIQITGAATLPSHNFHVLQSDGGGLKHIQYQCFGSAYVFMRIRIQDPKNIHMDPDADP